MDLAAKITSATTEIFSTMLMMEVAPEAPLNGDDKSTTSNLSGIIGLSGLFKGMLAIHTSDTIAKTITSNFLGMDVDEVDDDVKDAIGELANMLAGSIKMALSDNGKDIKLSVPSAICGANYRLECRKGLERVTVPFAISEGTFLVELQLQK